MQTYPNALLVMFRDKKIATMEELKVLLGTNANMTVFRKLKELSYLSSYSHKGKYYTLYDVVDFNAQGLWQFKSVWFSQYGNLLKTVHNFINLSEMGYSANELEVDLHVEVRRPLLQLTETKVIYREKVSGIYIYVSNDPIIRKRQLLLRKDLSSISTGNMEIVTLTHEIKAAIFLFYSILDEKQRRLYAGLEALKIGHGGDRKIAEILGLDVHTVARGRKELFESDVDPHTVRKKGAGRKSIKKKFRK